MPEGASGHAAAGEQAASRLRPRGSSQGGLRQYNERMLLQAIRLQGRGPAPSWPASPGCGANRLDHHQASGARRPAAARRAAARQGGATAVPLSLNPEGVFAVGVKVGRRSVDVLLIDFTGAVRRRWALDYRYPAPGPVLQQIGARLAEIRALLSPAEYARVQGVGIAVPFNLSGWQTLLEMPPEVAAQWPAIDLRAQVAALTDLPVALRQGHRRRLRG